MIQVICLLLILTAPLIANAQGVKTEYDKFKDRTTISGGPVFVDGVTENGVGLMMVVTYEGQKRVIPTTVLFYVFLTGPERRLSNDRELILILDGERLKLGPMKETESTYTNGFYLEASVVELPLEKFRQITKAQKAEGKLGPREFTFNAPSQTAMVAFLSEIEKKP